MPCAVDGIVFWTKNPYPMLSKLHKLNNYMYYFQFTLSLYDKDIETNLPQKQELILTFKQLSAIIGSDRVLWRYDPILINQKYSIDYHVSAFESIARELHGYTQKATISFIETDYRNVKGNMAKLALQELSIDIKQEIAYKLANIAKKYEIAIESCATSLNLAQYGIQPARCIDDRLFSKLLNRKLYITSDKNQRQNCGCVVSKDIGMYNTCKNGCLYCYANYNPKTVDENFNRHSPSSPLI